jgi:hypothetical protein
MKKKFEDLKSKRAQKMRIVQDAIDQIKLGVIIVTQGTYFEFEDSYLGGTDHPKFSLQKKLKQGEVCECCAKGALFAACVIETNKVNSHQPYTEGSFQKKKLEKWFSPLELDTIETAFEKIVVVDSENVLEKENKYGDSIPTALGKKVIKFGRKYLDNEKRLLAILKNIKLNGSFKP